MHPIFHITSSIIQTLNDGLARELVARLCKEELAFKGLSTTSISWGGDQRAKDGGVDVRIEINPAAGISGYIPKDSTAYQVKAESFSKSKIPAEMAPKNVLRKAITDLAELSGAYIIVSTRDDLSDSSLIDRKQAMAECLKKHGLAERVHLDFYDSRRISDWVENFPAIGIWVRNESGNPLEGWQSYGPWAYRENTVEDEYLLDDKVKVFAPDTELGIHIAGAIDRLRGELGKSKTSARIVGLSGVGKTRFVQALFDSRVDSLNPALARENVLYTDLSKNPIPHPIALLEALVLEGSDSVVVVDNCGQDSHQKLTEIVKRDNSQIRLVTIEYDIRVDLPEGTTCYRLEGSSNEVIAKLLKRRYQFLSDPDVEKIVEFSDGNARVAFALASTSENTGELAQLMDADLFQRLFVQKHSATDELQRCAEAASLLYSFDAEDSSANSELAILSSLSEVTIPSFLRNIVALQQRGLVQQRGQWRAVLPHAIANRLALKVIEFYPAETLVEKFVLGASERVARSFTRRLGYLHQSNYARNIVEKWLKPDGLLGELGQLNELKRQIFKNVAPVNQRAALNALLRSVESKDFISTSNRNRGHYARIIRSLAYEQDQFHQATSALLRFALEEPDDYKSDSVQDILESLFYFCLSGTQASPEQRATFVRRLVDSKEAASEKVALLLLRAGLKTGHISSVYDFDFGALKRDYGWYPKTVSEIHEWYGHFVSIAVDLGKSKTSAGLEARGLLGEAFRGLWAEAHMQNILTSAARELAAIDGWPDGWIAIRNTLRWDRERLNAESLEALKALEIELAPRDLLAKIQAKVLPRGTSGIELDDDFELESQTTLNSKANEEAQALGKAAALDEHALTELDQFIWNISSAGKIWHFGFGVGQEAISGQMLLDRIKQHLAGSSNHRIPHSPFLQGLIAGCNTTKPDEVSVFLDQAVRDDVWGAMFPLLQLSVGLNYAAYCRLVKCLELGYASSSQFHCLGLGRATDPLTVEQIGVLINLLSTKIDEGLAVAIDVLSMVINCASNKTEGYRFELQNFCLSFLRKLDWASISIDSDIEEHHLKILIEFGLAGATKYDDVATVLDRLIEHERIKIHSRRLGNILLPFFQQYPFETLDACYVQGSNGNYDIALRMLSGRLNEFGDTPVGVIPEIEIIRWCKVSLGDRCLFAAQTCKLLEKPEPDGLGSESAIRISNTAKSILAHAIDKKEILEVFISRFRPRFWSGSVTAIMRQRMQLLDQFNPSEDAKLSILIEDAKVCFSKTIAREEKQEQDSETSQSASFE